MSPPTLNMRDTGLWVIGYLLFGGEYQIYCIECVENENFHVCIARIKISMFSTIEMRYIWLLLGKSKFSLFTF